MSQGSDAKNDGREQVKPDLHNQKSGEGLCDTATFATRLAADSPEDGEDEPDLPKASVKLAEPWGKQEEERAAIVEYDGGIPRPWAEGFARLDPDCPPRDVPAKRWLTFIDDIGRFLDSPFCAVAATLDWGPHDLFGCDRDRPFARVDQTGLLWLLNGDKLRALTENTATIERRAGTRQTYRRKRNEPGRVLAWELTRSTANRPESTTLARGCQRLNNLLNP